MAIVFQRCTPQQEAEAVKSTANREVERIETSLKAGDKVFLISSTWFTAWCNYTGYAYDPQKRTLLNQTKPAIVSAEDDDDEHEAAPCPGPLDSTDLLDPLAPPNDLNTDEFNAAAPLRPGLKEREDFWILHEATWQLLKGWCVFCFFF